MPLFKRRKETRDNLTIANPAPSLLAWLNSDDFMGDAEKLGYTTQRIAPKL